MIEPSAYIPLRALTTYLFALTALGFGAMLWDKLSARLGIDRLSERRLATVAALGGFLGVIAGGLFLRHKTLKPGFWAPVAFAAFLWVMFLIAYFNPWILPF